MEQVYVLGKGLLCRMKINFVEEPDTMMNDLREIAPTFVLFAPRVWESIAADVRAKVMDATPFKQRLFDLGMKSGLAALEQGKRSGLADMILFRALRDRLGFTRLRSAATGGAALGPDTFKFFQAMGVPLRTLYGQTELLGAYTLHPEGKVDPDTTGVPMAGEIEIRIENADIHGVGEIVVRHPNMFLGYYKNPEASVADIKDGWLSDFMPQKTSRTTGQRISIPIRPELAAAIKAMKVVSTDTYLVTEAGKPFATSGSFGEWMRKACRRAGLTEVSSHGLRKLAMIRLAYAGCNTPQIMAISGHRSFAEVQRYVEQANRMRLAEQAMAALDAPKTRTKTSQK